MATDALARLMGSGRRGGGGGGSIPPSAERFEITVTAGVTNQTSGDIYSAIEAGQQVFYNTGSQMLPAAYYLTLNDTTKQVIFSITSLGSNGYAPISQYSFTATKDSPGFVSQVLTSKKLAYYIDP